MSRFAEIVAWAVAIAVAIVYAASLLCAAAFAVLFLGLGRLLFWATRAA